MILIELNFLVNDCSSPSDSLYPVALRTVWSNENVCTARMLPNQSKVYCQNWFLAAATYLYNALS